MQRLLGGADLSTSYMATLGERHQGGDSDAA